SQEDAEITPLEVELPNRVPTVKSWNDKAYAPEVAHAMRLIPSEHIEAFFVARIKKVGNS
ncbi:MAG: hypothetical protein JWL85_499, partial [Candidatus Saccharibacteria bacterium]|nr:hypothetical protein [Candidatus Saccharibacteria bacterium]